MELQENGPADHWVCYPITCVEHLQEAVLGAGLEAMQLSRGRVGGSLAFASDGPVSISSGYVNGRVCLTGSLSQNMTTLGLGIRLPQGSRQWMSEVVTGDIGIFRPGDGHEALYAPGSIYAAITLSDELLEEAAAEMELVLDRQQLGGSRIGRQPLPSDHLDIVHERFLRIHSGVDRAGAPVLCRYLLECLIRNLARDPRPVVGSRTTGSHSQIVARARRFILDNLDQPLSIGAIARASFTSRSALFRAFRDVLDDAPQSFIRKVRLHRIRRDLATENEARCTIALLATRWGIGEPGRFAGWYRDLFGELPSQTRAQSRFTASGGAKVANLGRTA